VSPVACRANIEKKGSSLFGVGRTARPVTASTVGARPIVQAGDRGNDAPWKARKTNFRFSLPSHRPWKSRLGAISIFPPSRRRFGDGALNSEQARPAVHASFIDPKAPPTQRFFATHTKQRGGKRSNHPAKVNNQMRHHLLLAALLSNHVLPFLRIPKNPIVHRRPLRYCRHRPPEPLLHRRAHVGFVSHKSPLVPLPVDPTRHMDPCQRRPLRRLR